MNMIIKKPADLKDGYTIFPVGLFRHMELVGEKNSHGMEFQFALNRKNTDDPERI